MFQWMREKFGKIAIGLIMGMIIFIFIFEGFMNPKGMRGIHEGTIAGQVNGEAIVSSGDASKACKDGNMRTRTPERGRSTPRKAWPDFKSARCLWGSRRLQARRFVQVSPLTLDFEGRCVRWQCFSLQRSR